MSVHFNSEMDRFDRNFKWFSIAVCGFIGIIFTTMVLYWVLIGTVLVKSASYIDQHGLKSVVEQVWNGKDGEDKHGLE